MLSLLSVQCCLLISKALLVCSAFYMQSGGAGMAPKQGARLVRVQDHGVDGGAALVFALARAELARRHGHPARIWQCLILVLGVDGKHSNTDLAYATKAVHT